MVFAEKYGDTLTKQLKIFLGDGMTTTFNYIKYERKIHGLHIFFKKYDVLDGYVIFFDYIGDSSFKVSIYDSQNTNHLRHCDGGYRFEDFTLPYLASDIIQISDNESGTYFFY